MNIISEAKSKVPHFLESLYRGNGFFSYTKESDMVSQNEKWGLGNAVFAVKTYSILNEANALSSQRAGIIDFIKSFKAPRGAFSDPALHRRIRLRNKLSAVKNMNFSNFFGHKTVMAETRQAIVALILLGDKPERPFTDVPYDFKTVDRYIKGLNWKNIWGASSHISHLLFFYKINADLFKYRNDDADKLIRHSIEFINSLQNEADGTWSVKGASAQQKINSAMKIITTYIMLGLREIKYAEKIIDYIINAGEGHYRDGCDNLNAMYSLKYAYDSVGRSYKTKEVNSYCQASLRRYEKYFFKGDGGFSRMPDSTGRMYYGMKVTRDFSGPDIHGTMLFTWAVALAADILNLNNGDFKEVIN